MPQTPRRAVQSTSERSDASLKEYKRQYHIKNRDKILLKVRKHYEANKEKRLAYGKKWRDANPEKMTLYRRKHVIKLKNETFDAYGGKACNCCGEAEPRFLSIDHINGGGSTHRKSLGNTGGKDFYTWLRKNSFPKGYQVLCFNCNIAKGSYGSCPHTAAPL